MSETVIIALIFITALAGALGASHLVIRAMRRGFAARQAALSEDPRGPWGG